MLLRRHLIKRLLTNDGGLFSEYRLGASLFNYAFQKGYRTQSCSPEKRIFTYPNVISIFNGLCPWNVPDKANLRIVITIFHRTLEVLLMRNVQFAEQQQQIHICWMLFSDSKASTIEWFNQKFTEQPAQRQNSVCPIIFHRKQPFLFIFSICRMKARAKHNEGYSQELRVCAQYFSGWVR